MMTAITDMSRPPAPADGSVLVLVDVQERLFAAFPEEVREPLVARLRLLLAAARELPLPVVVTEQYPQGLGPTIKELRESLDPAWPVVAKTSFSCLGEPAFAAALARSLGRETGAAPAACRNLVLCGIEAHVCIQQTALDALSGGFRRVIVPADAVASRHPPDHHIALGLLSREGVRVSTAEAIVFALLGDSRHPAFKSLSARVRQLS